MNKVIHRSWGEDFANIYLDLSIYISHSSSIFACPRGSANCYSCETGEKRRFLARPWHQMHGAGFDRRHNH